MKETQQRSCAGDTWLLQILAIIGSAVSMLAIGILLMEYNHQPFFSWNGVTLNAIISVLSALFKAMLAFTLCEGLGQAKWIWLSWQKRPLEDVNVIDASSRGPLGSVKLLAQPAARSFISLGAIVLVLSAAIDPFVQLTVGKKDDVKYTSDPSAQIPYATRYSKGILTNLTTELDLAPNTTNVTGWNIIGDFGMSSAVFYGLSHADADISRQAQFSCPSGNCTWAPFQSLAICSACKDLTGQVEDQGTAEALLGQVTGEQEPGATTTQYGLPNGLYGDKSVLMSAYGTGNRSESISFSSYNTLIWSMTMMNFTRNNGQTTGNGVTATECGLWYCVNEYTSVVKGGNLSETVKPAASERKLGSWQPIGGFADEDDSLSLEDNLNFNNKTFLVYRTDLQLGDGFNISQASVYSISDLMNTTFVVPSNRTGLNALVISAQAIDFNRGAINSPFYSPAAMQSLYNSQDLEKTFASLAQSMTNNIRQNDDSKTVSHGELGIYIILVQVRGWFLVLPVILLIGGAVFLALGFYHTGQVNIAFWGTNVLPIAALGERVGFGFNDDNLNASQMERDAKLQIVQFSAPKEHQGPEKTDVVRKHGDYEMLPPGDARVK